MDEDDYDEEAEVECPTWVEALTQEIADDEEGPEEDPDFEVGDQTDCCSSLFCILQSHVLFLAQHRGDGE